MSKPSNQKVSELVQQIEKRHRRLNRKRLVNQLLIPLCIVLLGFAVFTWLEQEAYFSSTAKTVSLLALVIGGAAMAFWKNRVGTTLSLSEFYSSVADGIQKPALKHALDLSLKSRDRHLKLYQSAINKNLESVSWEEIKPKINRQVKKLPAAKHFRRLLAAAGAVAMLLLISAFARPDAFMRTAHFWNNFQKPNPYSFTVTPGNTTIEQGGSFQPSITFEGSSPEELLLGLKTEVENNFRFRPLQQSESGTFSTNPIQLSSNASYFIKMGEFTSKQYSARVQLRPRFDCSFVEVFPGVYRSRFQPGCLSLFPG
ncbi:MAG: hypothetical protein U5K69_07910 [Balneolaceae bacterium]|nr:hypothetical protein [Balneolaceae bacterium]